MAKLKPGRLCWFQLTLLEELVTPTPLCNWGAIDIPRLTGTVDPARPARSLLTHGRLSHGRLVGVDVVWSCGVVELALCLCGLFCLTAVSDGFIFFAVEYVPFRVGTCIK